MVGTDSYLCFEVVVGVSKRISFRSVDDFNDAAEKYGVDMGGKDYARIPKQSYLETAFPPGWLLNRGDTPQGRIIEAQSVFATAPYRMQGTDPDTSSAAAALKTVMAKYTPLIERGYPELVFGSNNYADNDKLSVDFKYIVQPYDPQHCHPRYLNILKPITVIGEHIIHTPAFRFDD